MTILDEQVQEIDFDRPTDLVAITAWTLHSLRAYDIAAEFRRRGVTVIMGGPHVFFYPEESADNCDAVGIGEAEPIWAQMLADAAAGRLKKEYRAQPLTQEQLAGLPKPRYDTLNMSLYGPFRTYTLQSSRGCPLVCDFCSERLYLSPRFRWRPAEEVVGDVRHTGSRNILFGESNFGGKRTRAMELMEALIPLKARWSTLWTSNFCSDDEFLDVACRSGLLHVNIGIESIDAETISNMRKGVNKTDRYAEMFEKMRKRGHQLLAELHFRLGLREPDRVRLHAQVPGAAQGARGLLQRADADAGDHALRQAQGRGPDHQRGEMGRWPGHLCHVKPTGARRPSLSRTCSEMYRKFYTLPSMARRLPLPTSKASIANWVVNIGERRMARSATGNNDFDAY